MLEPLFAGLAYTYDLLAYSSTNLLAIVQPPLLMDPLLKLGNTAGDPLMKAEAQLRKPLHCLNLPLMCEQQS